MHAPTTHFPVPAGPHPARPPTLGPAPVEDPNRLSYFADPTRWTLWIWCKDEVNCARNRRLDVAATLAEHGDLEMGELRRRLKCKCGSRCRVISSAH